MNNELGFIWFYFLFFTFFSFYFIFGFILILNLGEECDMILHVIVIQVT